MIFTLFKPSTVKRLVLLLWSQKLVVVPVLLLVVAAGSALPWTTKNGRWVVVPAGSLDVDPGARPERNIFWDSRAPWYTHAAELPTFAEVPPRG